MTINSGNTTACAEFTKLLNDTKAKIAFFQRRVQACNGTTPSQQSILSHFISVASYVVGVCAVANAAPGCAAN